MSVACVDDVVTITRDVPYFGREKNVRLDNGHVEVILATEFGPRIMRYGRLGGRNVFGKLSPEMQGKDTPFGDRWHIYGGHRLWYAPEGDPRSYYPDNAPVRVDINGTRVTLTQQVERHTQLQKSIAVELARIGSRVSLTHTISNRGAFDIELAPWSLSVMAKGGRAILPHPPYVPHPTALAPTRPLVMWPFTRMSDPRWTWGDRFVFLRHDASRSDAQKIGAYDPEGFLAYELDDLVFIKAHDPLSGAHADFGCNVEIFTNDAILELETLGPIATIPPGGSVIHREEWLVFDGITLGPTEADVERQLRELLTG